MSALQTFLYFAYGSNLLAQRIHIQNPTAVRKGIGKLNDYRLDFNRFSERWGGCSATIVEDSGKHVWGAVWELSTSQMNNLDDQEGVSDRIYTPLQVKVITPNNETLECRVYKLIDEPEAYESADLLPKVRWPSRIYLETILQGAVESKLPENYINFLKLFRHNGFTGPVNVPHLNISYSLTSIPQGENLYKMDSFMLSYSKLNQSGMILIDFDSGLFVHSYQLAPFYPSMGCETFAHILS